MQLAALTVAAGQENRCDMLLVVRHADAGDKGSWNGPDAHRPLSPAGRRQAEGLVVRLEDYPVERILCSPTVRCHQTVQPIARDRLLRIERIAALGVDAAPAEVLALFWDRRLRNAVLCTHGETIGRLLSQLAADGLVATAPLQWPKGSTWLLQRTAPPQVRARYLAPLTLGDRVESASAAPVERRCWEGTSSHRSTRSCQPNRGRP
jgi:phosphohistidine phosphatase SixA